MNPSDSAREPRPVGVNEIAAQWLERRRKGLSEEERREFQRWLARDPRHARAFRKLDEESDELDWPLHAGKTEAVIAGLERRARRRRIRRFSLGGFAAAAGVATVIALWTPASVTPRTETALVVVEPRRQTLSDGTVAELQADAEIAEQFEKRRRVVVLRRGMVHFDVAADPERPFVVRVGDVAVRAVGTAFAIELKSDAMKVLVTHGRVAVEHDAAPASSDAPKLVVTTAPWAVVSAGNLAVMERTTEAASTGIVPRVRAATEADLEETLAWRTPRLEFSGTPLSEVVATMNRYNHVRFVLADESLATLRLSGALRSDKVEALVHILEADFPIRAARVGERSIELHRRGRR